MGESRGYRDPGEGWGRRRLAPRGGRGADNGGTRLKGGCWGTGDRAREERRVRRRGALPEQ